MAAAASITAMTTEATQKGLVDGLEWSDTDAMLELVEDMAFRNGLGADLAEGMNPCYPPPTAGKIASSSPSWMIVSRPSRKLMLRPLTRTLIAFCRLPS